jgi:hypothetical protein
LQKGSELVKETLAKSTKYCVQKDLEDAKLLQSLAIDLFLIERKQNPILRKTPWKD